VSSFSLDLLDVVYGPVLAFDRNEPAQVIKNHLSVTNECECVPVASVVPFRVVLYFRTNRRGRTLACPTSLIHSAARRDTGGCPSSLIPVVASRIGCERHSRTVSSVPQCKHTGHSVALGSAYRILRPLWQCDRFKNIGVSPCLSVYSFLVQSE
jgi:hypothetical protein